MSLTRQEFKKLRADLLAEIIVEISGLKTNQLPAADAVTASHLFVVADKTTGLAYQATEQQVREAIGANSFNSCNPATLPTNMKDGDVYWPETVGTYTNFKDAANASIVVTTTDAVVYFIYSTNHFVKKGNTVDLLNYVAKSALQNNFNAIAANTTGLDAAMGKTIKDNLDSRTLYGSYALQTLTVETGAINAATGALDPASTWSRCINIPVVPNSRLKFTAVGSEFLGIAGYDKTGNFIATLDSYGLPYGTLWNNTRYAAINGSAVVTGRVLYTDKEIIIPSNCYLVKASSGVTGTAPNSPVIVSLETYPNDAVTLKQRIDTNTTDISNNKNQLQLSSFVLQTLTMQAGNVTAQNGSLSSTAGWSRCVNIAVVPNQKLRLTCACSYTYGVAGYDKNGVFISTLDSYGLPYGHLWSKQRWTAITGLTSTNTNQLFVNVEIIIPPNCYLVKASSNVTGSSPHNYPLIISLETVDAKYVKQQVYDNAKDIDAIEKQLLSGTDVTGTTFQPELVKTSDGTLAAPTGTNVWEHSDFITVREANEAGKDIYIFYTGGVTGTRGDASSSVTGLAGYDANNNFISTLDEFNIPQGALWDYDRWAANGFLPNSTINSGVTYAFTDVLIKIPASVYKVRGEGAVVNASIGAFPLVIKKGVYISNIGLLLSGGGGASVQANYISRVAGNVNGWSRTAGNPNVKRFTFIHFSDIHYFDPNAEVNHDELNSFVNDSDAAVNIDAVLCTGDINEGIAAKAKSATMGETTAFCTRFLKSEKPIMYMPGNHDDNVNFDGVGMLSKTGVTTNAISKTELYNLLNGAIKTKYGLLQDVTNKLYSYQDFTTYGIRVIAIDRYECPVIDDGGGTGKIRYTTAAQMGHFYSQAQLDWLQTTLASVPAGWGLIVMTHGSFVNTISDFATATCLQGWVLIPSIIDAWKKGSTFNHSYTHPTFADMNTSKNFNFTARGTGNFITYIGGHSHCPYYGFIPAFPDQRTMTVACTFMGGMDQSTANTWGMTRGENQEIRNSFHIISVDRTNKKLYITFFGAHKDLSGNITTDSIVLPY